MSLSKDIMDWPGGKLDFSAGTLVMGILNVTDDSFSDGGEFCDIDSAVKHAVEMVGSGADIIDIGAESTRPGAQAVAADIQIARVAPIIEKLAGLIDVPISIDTFDSQVAGAALKAGAGIVNDITALSDENMPDVICKYQVPVVLMHIKGKPATMQDRPEYENVVEEVLDYLVTRARFAEKSGIKKEYIIIDPGIGFGKTFEHNLLLLKNIDRFVATGYRVLVGTSRKAFLGWITDQQIPAERVSATAATVGLCAEKGVSVVRVHDVAEMADVVKVINAIRKA